MSSFIGKFLLPLAVFIALFAPSPCLAGLLENPHNTAECSNCHKGNVSFDEPDKEPDLILKDIVSLCLTCHENILDVHHPQRVQVTEKVPDYLPVGEGNSIMCLTCHDLHTDDTSNYLLRSSDIGNYTSRIDLCYECHITDFKKISPHREEKEGISCLVCHRNAPTIKDTRETVTLVNRNVEKICNFCHNIRIKEHPMNVDTSVKISKELPRSEDNKIVCITCHDPHGSINTINFLRDKYVFNLEFGKYENPHNVEEYFNCIKCHKDVSEANEYVDCRYREDFILLCYNCHGADTEKCHVVNVNLSEGMSLPEKFKLNEDGLISCVTCHNPDCNDSKRIRYINLNAIFETNCNDCHDFGEIKKKNPHNGKDEKTEECYICHKKEMDMTEFGMSEKFICMKCHIFKEHPPGGNLKITLSKDIDGIKLDKMGRIKCSTCHDPHVKESDNKKLRTVEGMTICEACHQS